MELKLRNWILSKDTPDLRASFVRAIMRVLVGLLVLMGIIFVVAAAFKVQLLANTILPGVFVQDIAVGELTVDQAVAVLAQRLPALETLGVDVQVAGQTWPITWVAAGQRYDVQAIAQSAYNVGRNVAGKAALLAHLRDQNVAVALIIVPADPEMVRVEVARMAMAVAVEPVDAHFTLEADGTISSALGQPGQRLDIEASVAQVCQALAQGSPSVELALLPVSPHIVEPEPARAQAQAWLAEPFIIFINGDPINEDRESVLPDEKPPEFPALPERISTWFTPRVEGTGIQLDVNEAEIRTWLEDIAPQFAAEQPLDIDLTLQNVRVALDANQHRAAASIRPPTTVYTVQLGDTLSGIAYGFGITVQEIKVSNNLISDDIVVGQTLLIHNYRSDEATILVMDVPPKVPILVPDASPARSAEWRADLVTLVETLTQMPEIHEGAFGIVHAESFAQAVAALNANIPGLADHQIIVGMMRILALLGDAHSGVILYQWEAFQERAYPIELQWFQDGLFVTAVQPGYEDLLALELVQIGDVPISQVMAQLTRIIPHENMYRVRAASTNYIIKPVILHALGLAADLNSAAFTFQSAGGYNTRYLIADSSAAMQARWVFAVPRATGPLYLQKSDSTYYWYTYLESAQALYFQYNRCDEQPGTSYVDPLNGMAQVIQTQPVARLIIDLRRNPGGTGAVLQELLEHLQQHPQFSQQNRLFVLIGNQTFSAAVHLTSLLKQQANAILIGEPTAQGPNFYASPRRLVLPYSRLNIGYSAAYWESGAASAETITPDIHVTLSSTDYFAGNDPVLNVALSQP